MLRTEKKEAWPRFLVKALAVAAVILLALWWVDSRFRIGIDGQATRCLPDHKYYLVDLKYPEPVRDHVLAFEAKGLARYFPDGTLMAKIVRGMPGDHLVVDQRGVSINGDLFAKGFPLLDRLGVEPEALYRDETIPDGKYLMIAPAPESYDGRYWGYVDQSQFVGKVIPLL